MSAHTPGEWRRVPLGGFSTILTSVMPPRNDMRIPAYGYREELGHCIGYPFIEDDGRTRTDFICFSHDDARLIAAAPELLALCCEMRDWLKPELVKEPDRSYFWKLQALIAKAVTP